MSRTGTNLSLTIWNLPDDAYDHNQLAANWDAVDLHDHTGAPKGKQLTGASIAPGTITITNLAPNSVDNTKILPATILGSNIASQTITKDKLDTAIFSQLSPIGVCTPWFRPNTSFAVPTGWRIADGSVLAAGQHDWGAISVTLPNLSNRFVLGADNVSVNENTTGGSNSRTLSHVHQVASHSHPHNHVQDSHAHQIVDHAHGILKDGGHNHTIVPDGAHGHTYLGGYQVRSRQNAFLQGITVTDTGGNARNNTLQSLYLGGFNAGSTDTAVPLDSSGLHDHGGTGSVGNHDHGGVTQGCGSVGTYAATPAISSDSTGSGVLTTGDVNGGAFNLTPAYVGLLYIVKVRNG